MNGTLAISAKQKTVIGKACDIHDKSAVNDLIVYPIQNK